MYCPSCATPLSTEQKFCRACGFDMQIVARTLARETSGAATDLDADAPPKSRRAKMELRGLIAMFSAFMVGSLIPICMGLFPDWPGLDRLKILLGGVAGFLLFGGILLLIYSDSLPKADAPKTPARPTPAIPSIPTNELPPANSSEAIPGVAERTTDLLPTAANQTRKDA